MVVVARVVVEIVVVDVVPKETVECEGSPELTKAVVLNVALVGDEMEPD